MKKNKSTKKWPEVKLTKAQGLEAFEALRILHNASIAYYEYAEKEISDLSSDLEKVQTELDESFESAGVSALTISDLRKALEITNGDADKWNKMYIAERSIAVMERSKSWWTRLKEDVNTLWSRS